MTTVTEAAAVVKAAITAVAEAAMATVVTAQTCCFSGWQNGRLVEAHVVQ